MQLLNYSQAGHPITGYPLNETVKDWRTVYERKEAKKRKYNEKKIDNQKNQQNETERI